ncbi:uncharacterized protein E0L32_011776 [Thyridium curvatum]|uniref:Uncharacterized protein n=1 Tax=Thyridium curvatum TaxID=1093900 RepID=A0A507BEE0_9PEZI|nr:uncharacterized protein E0L32_011776 [Thyridium curvatum]TPX18327.1 hypothetical protein E0L32_011776 [Thyridium curvatum]
MGASSAADLAAQVEAGQYLAVLSSPAAQSIIKRFVAAHLDPAETKKAVEEEASKSEPDDDGTAALAVGTAALNAFLQANVTGPALGPEAAVDALFFTTTATTKKEEERERDALRAACLRGLDVDGSSAYAHVPHPELFALARFAFEQGPQDAASAAEGKWMWMRLRGRAWHYRLLTQPSLGPGSVFNRAAQWSDVPSLQEAVLESLREVEQAVVAAAGGEEKEEEEGVVEFLVEKANVLIMLGMDAKAREALRIAAERSRFAYALSGALGKRTRWQEKSTSQLVVLAKSGAEVRQGEKGGDGGGVAPEALKLNDDTLLEGIEFNKEANGAEAKGAAADTGLPPALQGMAPDEQGPLSPLDQIILLTEATLKDAFSPADSLTSEEILPFAVRVLDDESRNWQIYTQALLVRSRIEMHRSRTIERGVLQMQALVDQVVVETATREEGPAEEEEKTAEQQHLENSVPSLQITEPDAESSRDLDVGQPKPTSFFPAAKPSESAPPQVRLRYIHALASPPRWHLESELAYAWASVGSLVSALEIFKRLRLWAEVALCQASSGAAAEHDEDGRGSGGEDKARAVLRWRLFTRTDGRADDPDAEGVDVSELKAADYMGPEREPAPSGAPRLYCILGDVEGEPAHYVRAWELSGHRYARAQKSLAEHLLQQKDWEGAREAYRRAVAVNRMSPEMWSRLGDINLRLGAFEEAAESFSRAIGAAGDVVGGEDARTWSNLGSALYSLYVETVEALRKEKEDEGGEDKAREERAVVEEDEEEDGGAVEAAARDKKNPAALLAQSLSAYKRGAAIAHDNWRIWDNVITLASRLRPVAVADIVQATRAVVGIRGTEDAVDDGTLRLLVNEAVLPTPRPGADAADHMPARGGGGGGARAVVELLEGDVVPLITHRSELWELVSRERVWRRDYAGGIDAAEKAWRAAVGGAGVGATLGAVGASGGGGAGAGQEEMRRKNWLEDEGAWGVVVSRTDELVGLLENYGEDVPEIGSRWRGKARSAVRSVMSKGRERWEGSEGWRVLEGVMDGLKV